MTAIHSIIPRRLREAAAWLFLTVLVAGCGSGKTVGGGVTRPTTLSLAADLQPLLSARCAVSGCHAGSSPQAGMDLSAGQAHAQLVNVESTDVPGLKRVNPGDPATSFLYEKVSQEIPSVGSRMPQTGQPLSAAEIESIRLWIEQGAAP